MKCEACEQLEEFDVDLPENCEACDRIVKIVEMARDLHEKEGELEIDDSPDVRESPDNGAYVSAYIWISFAGTPLDKEKLCDACGGWGWLTKPSAGGWQPQLQIQRCDVCNKYESDADARAAWIHDHTEGE